MSDFETLARPYSKAIFELASEQSELQTWSDVLQLAALVASDESTQVVMSSPSVLTDQLSELFVSVMSSAEGAPKITQEAKNLIALLAENGRLAALPAIYESYEALKQEAEGVVEVKVTSARKLTQKQEKDMADKLRQKLGKDVTISAEVDKSLIAGAIIYAGDLVIDGSARGRLGKLTSTLNK